MNPNEALPLPLEAGGIGSPDHTGSKREIQQSDVTSHPDRARLSGFCMCVLVGDRERERGCLRVGEGRKQVGCKSSHPRKKSKYGHEIINTGWAKKPT